jgi:hypothetical protein
MINRHSPQGSGVTEIDLATEKTETIPYTLDFKFRHGIITVNFWIVQALRRNVPLVNVATGHYEPESMKENFIGFIKAIRANYSLGLKEAKDICEWFRANVDRDTVGIL